eukprot:12650292-Alexandrium_andersonii.AAC.1
MGSCAGTQARTPGGTLAHPCAGRSAGVSVLMSTDRLACIHPNGWAGTQSGRRARIRPQTVRQARAEA